MEMHGKFRMTGKERCRASVNADKLDRPPFYAFISSSKLVDHICSEELRVDNATELLARTYAKCVDCTRQLLSDMFIVYEDGKQITDDYGFLYRQSRFTQWVEKRPWHDLSGMAKVIKRQIEDMATWEPDQQKDLCGRYELCEKLSEGKIMLMGRAYVGTAPGSYFRDGLDNWVYFLADYPDLARAWVDARHQMNLKRIKSYADPQRCPIEHMDADVAGKNGLLVSPHFLRRSGWYDRLSELVETYHQAGVRIVFHSDGDIRSILHDLLATGIDGLNPIDTSAGMSLAQTRKAVGRDLLLVGGLDHRILLGGTTHDVRRHVKEQMAIMRGSPWWVGSSTEELDDGIPLENIVALLETIGIF